MARGTVKFFDEDRGFGFLETDDADDDVFFHVTDLEEDAAEVGDEFTFDIQPSNRGPRAVDLTRL